MLTLVQQTPLPLDPLRQQITPAPPVAAPAPPRPADTPLEPASTPQDRYATKDDDAGGQGHRQRDAGEWSNELGDRLRDLRARLGQLRLAAEAALAAADFRRGQQLAEEIAVVVRSIGQIVGQVQDRRPIGGMTAPLAIVRAALPTALLVINTLMDLAGNGTVQRHGLAVLGHQVEGIMDLVEGLAADVPRPDGGPTATGGPHHLDIQA